MKHPEKYRHKDGLFSSKEGDDFGLFFIPTKNQEVLKVICAPSDSEWQHVSVSLPNRCPTWGEMSKVKDLFWDEEDTVLQFHPKKSEYVNNHPYCLHLWRHRDGHKTPPSFLTGVKI